ncbi:MAG: hypothetical protein Q8P18_24525 [Pseudomonadota bacterium]|nr:hypothetical protein [Pseudomonadota bacterium]
MSVSYVPGSYARVLHGWTRALAQLAVPSSARAVLDAVTELYAGVLAARVQRDGVALTVRTIAARYGLHSTHVQRGMTWALDHGLLARRVDPEHPGCYRYALTHPSHWSPTPMSGHGLAQVRVEGWDSVLLDVTLGALAARPELSTKPVDNPTGGVHTDRHTTRARSSSEEIKEEQSRSIRRDSSLSKADGWYFWRGSGQNRARIAVTWWISEQIEARWPIAFEVLAGQPPENAPAWLVAELHEALSTSSEVRWTVPMVRIALARAVEARAVVAADRAEWARRVEERSSVAEAQRAARLLAWWHELAPFVEAAGAEYALDAPRAAAAVEAGELSEIDVFAAYLDAISEAREAKEGERLSADAFQRCAVEDARRLSEAGEAGERLALADRVAAVEAESLAGQLASEVHGAIEREGPSCATGREGINRQGLAAARADAAEWLGVRGATAPAAWIDGGRGRLANLVWWRARVSTSAERLADAPAVGGSFGRRGRVEDGPAEAPLEQALEAVHARCPEGERAPNALSAHPGASRRQPLRVATSLCRRGAAVFLDCNRGEQYEERGAT